jgi:hypothetical protein
MGPSSLHFISSSFSRNNISILVSSDQLVYIHYPIIPMWGLLKPQDATALPSSTKKSTFWTTVSCTNYTSCTLVSPGTCHVKKKRSKENTRNHPQISAGLTPPDREGKRLCHVDSQTNLSLVPMSCADQTSTSSLVPRPGQD